MKYAVFVLIVAIIIVLFTIFSRQTKRQTTYVPVLQSKECTKQLDAPKDLTVSEGGWLHWAPDPKATSYNLRIDDMTKDPWNGYCDGPNSFDLCWDNMPHSGILYHFYPDHRYRIWVHAVDGACGTISKPALINYINKVKNTKWFPPKDTSNKR